MISVKYALVIVAAFVAGSFLTPPVQEAIAAVIATDVQCTGCVGANDLASSAVTTTKLASNSVNGGKISDGTLSAADLGPDSVGASEIKGVSQLIFGTCSFTLPGFTSGQSYFDCPVSGVQVGQYVVATTRTVQMVNGGPTILSADVIKSGIVRIGLAFDNPFPAQTVSVSVIVFQK